MRVGLLYWYVFLHGMDIMEGVTQAVRTAHDSLPCLKLAQLLLGDRCWPSCCGLCASFRISSKP